MNRFRYLISTLFLMLVVTMVARASDVETMNGMVMRLFPDKSKAFVFHSLSSSNDCFTLRSQNGRIVISGNNANSMAVGLNYYLKNYCLTTVSWFKADPIELPKVLPLVKGMVSISAKVPNRFFLNYCTYGYTMPWWNWKDWERFIDWMALNGVNMPLAITGQEAIWYNVWRKLGLTDQEIRSYFTGPAHLPWQRMCNVDRWQGPLPMSWLNGQKELQKLIVARERELNMKPILPAFNGHIPAELKRLYPHLQTSEVSKWGGFDKKYNCTFLSPLDSMYTVIQKAYLNEQTQLYGTNHIYGVDPFNEVTPPSWREDSLSLMSSRIYESMKAVDKDAVWLQMTWLFYYDAKHWTEPRVKAMVRGVPQDKMILLDYFCENTEIWQRTHSYFGQPFIWCYLGNFGGNTLICAPLAKVSTRLANTFQKAGNNFSGIGATLEGFDVNPYAFEFLFDKAWNIPQTDAQWISNMADRRLGSRDAGNRQAWSTMLDKIADVTSGSFQGTLIEARPSLGNTTRELTKKMQPITLLSAMTDYWRGLLSAKGALRDTYRFDVVNAGRQVLGMYFHSLRDRFTAAYRSNNLDSLKILGSQMKSVLTDVDALVACHSTFSLRHWIESARALGIDTAEKDYYEKNARTLITVWGDSPSLTDYARRCWAGLVSSYYAPRWFRFIDEVTACDEQHKSFDENSFKEQSYIFERSFIEPSFRISYTPGTDAVALSKRLLDKYFK